MQKQTIATALLAGLFCMSSAQAYQAEVGVSGNYFDYDDIDAANSFGVDGTYYFTPVQVKNNPLNEAAFLNRTSNVSASLGYGDNSDIEMTTLEAGLEYFLPTTDFYFSVGISHLKIDTPIGDADSTAYKAEVGYLPAAGLLVAVGLLGTSEDNADDDIDPTIRAKYITQMAGYDMNFEGVTSFGDTDYYNVGADLYLDKTFSIGTSYASDFDNVSDDEWSIRAKKFFTQQVSLEGSVAFGDDANSYGLRGAYRF